MDANRRPFYEVFDFAAEMRAEALRVVEGNIFLSEKLDGCRKIVCGDPCVQALP
jgi:hypothetical protein